MDSRITVLFCLLAIAAVTAFTPDSNRLRERRDVMESMKNAWNEVVKTFSDAGDAVVNIFKPTERSVVLKVADVFVPTEKSTLDKMADGIKNLAQ